MQTNQIIHLPEGGSIEVTHKKFYFSEVDAKRTPFKPNVMGIFGAVQDERGVTIAHCNSHQDATMIANALNFWSRAQLLDGNHRES